MIVFFKTTPTHFFAVSTPKRPDFESIKKLKWLFGDATFVDQKEITGSFIPVQDK